MQAHIVCFPTFMYKHAKRHVKRSQEFLREFETSHIHHIRRTRRAHLFIEFKTYELLGSALRDAQTALRMNKIHIEPIRVYICDECALAIASERASARA